MQARLEMDEHEGKLRDTHMDNVSTDISPCESDNAHKDPPPCQVPGSHNHSPQQPPQENPTRQVESTSSQFISSSNVAADSFEAMLEELRSEVPLFRPFPSDKEVFDWFKNTSPNEELLSTGNADDQELQDDFSDSVKKLVARSDVIPERTQAEFTQPSGSTLKPGVSTDSDSEYPTKPPEQASNIPQNESDEDPLAFGSLSIPIADQYPCFQASSNGDSIEIDESVFKAFRDDRDDPVDCNFVTVGILLNAEDLPKLKQKGVAKAAPEHVFENPPDSDLYRNLTSILNKDSQEQRCFLSEDAEANKLDSKDRACSSVDVKLSENTSGRGTFNVENTFNSDSAESCIRPVTTAPPAPASVPLDVLEPENTEGGKLTNQDGILDPGGLTLSQAESLSKQAFDLHLKSQIPAEELLSPSACSLSEQISRNQEAKVNTNTPVTQKSSGVYSQGTPLVSSNQQHCPSVGNDSPSRGEASMNLSLPIPSHGNPNIMFQGHPLVTPTSIISPHVPLQFQNSQQQVPSKEFSKRVENIPFDVQHMNVRANLGWGRKTMDLKRKICEVGSSYQTPSKKSRTTSSIPRALQGSGKKSEDTSHLSRLVTHQAATKSPNLSSSTHPITNASKSPPTVCDLAQNFVPDMQFPPGDGQAQSTQAQASEATVTSPSILRSTNVRDEGGQHLKRFVCSECPAAYAFKENCERHFKVAHQGRTVYFCHHCSASYLQSKTMRCHVDKKHHVLDGENSIFPCYWCSFKTNTEKSWSMHVSEMHPGHKNSFRGNSG